MSARKDERNAESQTHLDASCDLLVIGSGAAGFSAAVSAAHLGMRVIIVEKHRCFGGTTAWSGGVVWVPCNPVSLASGVEDSLADARTYLQHEHMRFESDRVDAYLNAAPTVIDFFTRETDVAFNASLHGDRHPEHPGGLISGRSLSPLPYDGTELGDWFEDLERPPSETMLFGMQVGYGGEFVDFLNATRSLPAAFRVARHFLRYGADVLRHGRGTRLYNGNALIARLARTAQRHGVELWLNSPAIELMVEANLITGVLIMRDGLPVRIRSPNVVIATGGYPHQTERVVKTHAHVRAGSRHYSRAPKTNVGDGIRMAEAVGAAFDDAHTSPVALTPVSVIHGKDGSLSFQPHLFDRVKPGFIAVTSGGVRYCDETISYHDFVLSMIKHCQTSLGVRSYLVCDHRALRKYGMGGVRQAPLPYKKYLRSGYLKSGASPAELARTIGIDPAILTSTIGRYNFDAANGIDSEYHRGESTFSRLMGDPTHLPNPCVGPLATPPYYAVEIFPGDIGTFAGLRTDAEARVLTSSGAVIAGLYAAGNDMSSVMGGAYPAGGITIGPAIVFGHVAARHAHSRRNGEQQNQAGMSSSIDSSAP